VTETLAQLSTVFLYAAMGLYAAAFIAFALDLARRGARATAVEAAVVPSAVARRAEVAAPVGAGATTVIGGGPSDAPPEPSSALGRLSSRISSRVEDDLVAGSANSLSMRWAFALTIVGFIAWTFTLIAGAIWAEKAWGRYWGWDTKEVWTFIIWVIYAGYIHARATRGWRGSRSAWLAIIGFAAVLFNFGIVNVFFHGLHAYSGL
jgi:hypothetical protein